MHNIHFLKYCQLYPEVFLWILAKIVKQFRAFAGECGDVVRGYVEIVVESLVGDELADGAFASLRVGD